ncbi:MAG: hemolysin family protein [Fermentimonas sp.]|nr:hemolysin family protein [Fermentimonas sp.]
MAISLDIGLWITFLVLSVFFSGIDMAFVASDKLQFAVSRKSKGVYNFMLNSIYAHPRIFLATLMIGKVITLVLFIYFTILITVNSFGIYFNHEWIGAILIIISSTLIILISDELIPRTLFKINPNSWVKAFAIPAFIFYALFYPIAYLFIFISEGILRLFGIKSPQPNDQTFSRVDLDTFVKKSIDDLSRVNEMDSEVKIFRNALDFSSMKLRDCMVPRADIVAVSIETDIDTLKERFIETGISRILVFKEDIDDIAGYIHMWEIFSHPKDWTKNIASISFVPESMQASKLMSDLMQQRKSIAVVVDEFGGTSGIVTMEDLVEEIFGEIEDEYDVKSKFVKKESKGQYVLSGRVEIDHLNEIYGLEIPESDEYSTVAGFLLHHTQRFPKTYETVIIGDYTFKILKVTDRKIEVVRLISDNSKEIETSDE